MWSQEDREPLRGNEPPFVPAGIFGKLYIGAADLAMDWAAKNDVKLVVNCANMEPRCSPTLW
jgi:hypothetical protein